MWVGYECGYVTMFHLRAQGNRQEGTKKRGQLKSQSTLDGLTTINEGSYVK